MPLHPQVKSMLEQMEASGLPQLWELSPEAARVQSEGMRELIGDGPELASVRDITIPTGAGPLGGRVYEPEGPPATIVWFHGGGWVIGNLDSHDAMCRMLSESSGCRVIAVDYRLAPEHPFPEPLEDCWEALRWAAREHPDQPLVVGGDSAGGNMAAVCALRARDRGGPPLALQVLVYPVTDYDWTRPSYELYGSGSETFLTMEDMRWFTGHYLPDPASRQHPEAAPLRVADLSGVAPAIVLTAEYDPLRDEGRLYAERLRESGVEVSHHHYDDVVHAFFSFVNLIERGNEAVAAVGSEIRAAVWTPAVSA